MTGPRVILLRPWQDPINTVRATTVEQMYTMVLPPLNLIYEVGIPPIIGAHLVKFRNNTQNTDLRVVVQLPSYLQIDIELDFIVLRNSLKEFNISFVESDARYRSQTNSKIFDEYISVVVTPLNVTEPVYVFTNLPTLE